MEIIEFVNAILELFPVVAVAATLIAVIVDCAKKLGLADGYAGFMSLFLNAAAWVGLYVAQQQGVEEQVTGIIDNLTQIAPAIVALILSLVGSKLAHNLAMYLGIGYSHSK